jgi:hypothetical protein
VAAPDGSPVRGLTPESFQLSENGQSKPIAVLEPLSTPVHVALVIDTSGSAAGTLEKLVQAAEKFINEFSAADQMAIYQVGTGVQRLIGFTSDRKTLKRALKDLTSPNPQGSVLHDALAQAQQEFPPDARRRALVLFSDGVDEGSRSSLQALTDTLLRSHGLFFAVMPVLGPEPAASSGGSRADAEWVVVFDLTKAGKQDIERYQQTAHEFLDTLGPRARVWFYVYRSVLRLLELSDSPERPASYAVLPAEARALVKKIGTPPPIGLFRPSDPKRTVQNLLVCTDRERTGLVMLDNHFSLDSAAIFVPADHSPEERRGLLNLLVHHRDQVRRAVWLRLREGSEQIHSLANETGGEVLSVASPDELPKTYRAISEQIRFSYTLGYYSQAAPGRHAIRLEVPGQPATVRARSVVLIE